MIIKRVWSKEKMWWMKNMNKYMLMVNDLNMAFFKEMLGDKIEFMPIQAADTANPALKVIVLPWVVPVPSADVQTNNQQSDAVNTQTGDNHVQ